MKPKGETMTVEQKGQRPSGGKARIPPELEKLGDPELRESFRKQAEEIRNRLGSTPALEEIRAMMGERLGSRTLKEVLRELDDRV